ncbi:MAG: AtpZ/AtpI family protein [Bacteroidota bacterium]
MLTPKNQKLPKKPLNNYAKYSAMGFQMGAIIFVGMYGGIKLDEYLGIKKFPVFTLLLSLAAVFGAIYLVIKDFLKK